MTIDIAIQENNPLAFRLALNALALQARDPESDRVARMLIEQNRMELFQLFVARCELSGDSLAHVVRLDRAAMLSKVRMPPDDNSRLALVWECFQHNAAACFTISLRGLRIDEDCIFLMNKWLYAHAAHNLVPQMIGRRLFRPECIRDGLLGLRSAAPALLATLVPYTPYFDSPNMLVEMIERGNIWFIQFYALHIRSICRDSHALLEHFKDNPEASVRLRAFCTCRQPWVPHSMRLELAANWQTIKDSWP